MATYYHIIEYGNYNNVGWQGYYKTLDEAKKRIDSLNDFFPKSHFEVFISTSKNEPPITTV